MRAHRAHPSRPPPHDASSFSLFFAAFNALVSSRTAGGRRRGLVADEGRAPLWRAAGARGWALGRRQGGGKGAATRGACTGLPHVE